jgi:hypothetical protein
MHPPLDETRVVRRGVAETLLPFLRAFWVPLDWMASLLGTTLFAGPPLFRGIMVVLMRGVGLMRRVRVVLAPVVFLSGAFGHLWFPLARSYQNAPVRQALPGQSPR